MGLAAAHTSGPLSEQGRGLDRRDGVPVILCCPRVRRCVQNARKLCRNSRHTCTAEAITTWEAQRASVSIQLLSGGTVIAWHM
jgi:hypothetical protein